MTLKKKERFLTFFSDGKVPTAIKLEGFKALMALPLEEEKSFFYGFRNEM